MAVILFATRHLVTEAEEVCPSASNCQLLK